MARCMKNGLVDVTRAQYITELLQTYSLVSVLSEHNDCRVLRVRHRSQEQDMTVRSFPQAVAAYEELYPIQCENLPLIYDVIDLDDGQIVLEEYIDGITIAAVMESGRYRYIGAKKVLTAVCRALMLLHDHGFVHRDVKPENVMITPDGRVVLIDLNISRRITEASKDTVIMGTVGYASPEQLGISQSDTRTDIYAVGVLFNVMLTGKHPSEQLARGRAGRIVRKCTSVNPADRYQSAEALKKAL